MNVAGMRYGCATRPVPNMPEVKANRKCQAAETGLSLEMANKLNNVMPGSGGTSCLERYEYAKHGVCFGFDPDSYFGAMVRLNGEIKPQPGGDFLGEALWPNRSAAPTSTPPWPAPGVRRA
ncbi:ribonuclease I [Klebsiella pneumoniae]|uniref:Ribonuclease I n=1 Tax=Klebsiella pneumoniae TaxID=573 RepID=A0A378FQT6_KLEPN|nr:ribonuclease I [Klebsiella pneumoniae]